MTQAGVLKALQVAKRFQKEVNLLLEGPMDWNIVGTKTSGSVRRASMDLTRALAEMRKGRNR